MAPAPPKLLVSEQLLHSSALELKYEQSKHAVELLAKEEDIRRLRFDIHILEDEKEELLNHLNQEEDRCAEIEMRASENQQHAEDMATQLRDAEKVLREREWQLQAALAEKAALQSSTEDASVVLAEKLALTRELSLLKPEHEHWKAKAAQTEELREENLSLQKQMAALQSELDKVKRDLVKAQAKRRNTGVEIAQEEQLDNLKRQLSKEKRARERAERAAEAAASDTSVEDLRNELATERQLRQNVEERMRVAESAPKNEHVRKELLEEQSIRANLEQALADLKQELASEKAERQISEASVERLSADLEKATKAAARAAKRADKQAQADNEVEQLREEIANGRQEKAQSDEKLRLIEEEVESLRETTLRLDQLRVKHRALKEKFKASEADLASTREALAKATAQPKTVVAVVKKRKAAQIDIDASTLGTPGNAAATKRNRTTGVGDKSTFSVTPFLNKTVSVIQDRDEDKSDSDGELHQSPANRKLQPLAEQSPSVKNKKPAVRRKPKSKPVLTSVSEENEEFRSQNKENEDGVVPVAVETQTIKVKTKQTDGAENAEDPNKKPKRIRKSIADIPKLAAEPEVKRKKRKLGGLGKTLFDDDEDEAGPAASKGTLGGGKAVLGKKFGLGVGAKTKLGGTLLNAGDGSFQFSPLKKARRNLDDTLRG